MHILKAMEIFPNIHTKFDQGALVAHNCHLGRCPKIWLLGTLVKVRHLDFWPKKWVTGWILSNRWVPQGGMHRITRPRPSTLHKYLLTLWC
jgi:hypothetical protein